MNGRLVLLACTLAAGLLFVWVVYQDLGERREFTANVKRYQASSDDCVKREQATANDEGERFDALLRCARMFPGSVPVQTVIEQESYWLHEMKRQLERDHHAERRDR